MLAEQELERIAHITRQTLGFYRDSNKPKQIDVPALIDFVLKLSSNKFTSKNITIERDFGACPLILGVQGEFTQVISNLISNAADAVDSNGTIKVSLECIEEPGGAVVQVVIEDDGPGIAPEDLDRIFEPFFTTKEDVGTGLGLWVTKEIIDRNGGSIAVRPRSDDGLGGAAFTVHLPVIADGQNVRPQPLQIDYRATRLSPSA